MYSSDQDAPPEIVLASASPRRRDLLRLLEISFTVQVADVDETPCHGELPDALTRRLSRAKALAVSATHRTERRYPGRSGPTRRDLQITCDDASAADPLRRIVLAADTVVVLGNAILNKPRNDAEAVAMLAALRSKPHAVMTGIAFAVDGEIVWDGVTQTTVWMRAYAADEVERYVRSGKPRDKAGAYGIQDAEFHPVERIDGCLANVVGLPLCEVRRALATIDPARFPAARWVSTRSTTADLHDVCDRALESQPARSDLRSAIDAG
jgi:MAF protein